MLRSMFVEIDNDPEESLIVQLYGESESEHRTFWVRGLVLLERVARTCLTTRYERDRG